MNQTPKYTLPAHKITKFNYYRYKLLSNITFGALRKKYEAKTQSCKKQLLMQTKTQSFAYQVSFEKLLNEIHDLKHQIGLMDNKMYITNLAPDLQTTQRWRFPNMIGRVNDRELELCCDLIQKNLENVYLAPTDIDIRNYSLNLIPQEGMILEFGVFQGTSINHISKVLISKKDYRTVHGFDSFEGLSHDGHGWIWEKGRFSLGGVLPKVEDNVVLHKGWIDDTLPLFLDQHLNEKIAFIHIDVDIYEPTKTILMLCKSRLVCGSIIVFDELIGSASWRFHEYKALTETFSESEFEYIAFSDYYQAAIRIL